MIVRDIMTTQLSVVAPETSIWAALAMMRQEGVRNLIVVQGGDLAGVLSSRDYRRVLDWIGPDGTIPSWDTATVAQIMTGGPHVVTVHPEDSIPAAARLIVEKKIGCLPVVERGGHLIGLVTQKDIIAALLALRA